MKQYVDFDVIHSNTAYTGTGVPQGPIHGPLLFIIYMNDIYMASQNFIVILYPDDTNLISPLCSFISFLHVNKESIDHISDQINTELGNIQEWLNINKLSLNVKKTEFMIFSPLSAKYKQYHTKVKNKFRNNRKSKRI